MGARKGHTSEMRRATVCAAGEELSRQGEQPGQRWEEVGLPAGDCESRASTHSECCGQKRDMVSQLLGRKWTVWAREEEGGPLGAPACRMVYKRPCVTLAHADASLERGPGLWAAWPGG